MVIVSVLYPKSPTSHFDYTYYEQKHIPLVRSLLSTHGLERVDLMRGTMALDGSPAAFELLGHLVFSSVQQVQEGLAAAGAEIVGDIPNFTNVQPLIQINQSIEASERQ